MSDHLAYVLDDIYRPWPVPASTTSLTWILLTTVFGAYGLAKALELAGIPISLCVAQLADASGRLLRLRTASVHVPQAGTGADTMQRASGLLSGIFGSHTETLLQRGVNRFASALSSGPSNVPPGLGNISNSCYQNSVIQGLAALPSLRDYLSAMTAEYPSLTADSTHGALYDLLNKLNDPSNLGKNFWINGKLKSMSTFTQQDAQEYFSKILDDIDNEAKQSLSSKRRTSVSWLEATKNLSHAPSTGGGTDSGETGPFAANLSRVPQARVLSNPLDGLIAQRVGCTSCGYSEGLSLITFNCITVSLGSNYNYDIRECLDEYTKLEYIDGVECAKCTLLKLQKTLAPLATTGSPFETKLNNVSEMIDDEKFEDNTLVKTLNIPKKNWVQSSKSKQIVVARAPRSLILHVNRSNFDETTGASYKNTAGVSYPRTLDLGNWCLGASPSGSRQPDMSLEEWPRDPTQSMLLQPNEPMTASPFQYKLRAAVTHFGSHGNGHYICYRPHARTTTMEKDDPRSMEEHWWRFSDDAVYAVPEEQVHQANVFMLFYERVDANTDSESVKLESLPVLLPVAEDSPLPPEAVQVSETPPNYADFAVTVPLPDDDDDLVHDLHTAQSSKTQDTTTTQRHVLNTSFVRDGMSATPSSSECADEPIGSGSDDTETDLSGRESKDAPSLRVAPDSETELFSTVTPKPLRRVPPHMMRTAGVRRQGSRPSLPLVSAT